MTAWDKQKAPLSSDERSQLKADAKDIWAAVERKNLDVDKSEARHEVNAAAENFELGCWLKYYSNRIGQVGEHALEDRIDCADRIFSAGIQNPKYDFHVIFDFGEREFDTLFEMGDSEAVIEGLRDRLALRNSPGVLKAFENFGWEIASRSVVTPVASASLERPAQVDQMDLFAHSVGETGKTSAVEGRIDAAVTKGQHHGPIISVVGNTVVQSAGRSQTVTHDLRNLDVVPRRGEHAAIKYANGCGTVSVASEKERSKGNCR